MAAARPRKTKYISVRIQILPFSALKDKATEQLTAFRLRLDEESTFANVVDAALERYAKQDPERPSQTVPAGIFDEKSCALDLDDGVDILEDGEVLKLVLASNQPIATESTPNNADATNTGSRRPSQTPAVKKIRPRTPALLYPLATRSSSRPRSSGLNSDSQRVIRGSGGRQDPYELPSDTENGQSQHGRTVGADLDDIGSRNGMRRRASASSSYSCKSVKSAGSLTLTPSRVAAATKDLLAQFQREAKEREDAKRQAVLRQAEAEEEKKRAKAQARQNRPSAAIARIKSMTGRKLRRKEPGKPVPDSFYDSVHSEEENISAIIRAQSPTTESEVSEQDTKLPDTVAKLPKVPQSKAIVRTTSFKPINRLWPDRKAQSQPTKKFGPGYSQRVRDAFSDSDESDADDGQPATVPNRLESDDGSTDSTPGTPEPFRHWFSEYETNFVPHVGFCSVADGPFKGLIRSGPQKGKYLTGHGSPSTATIDEMRKTAVPKEQLSNFWSSDSEATDVSDDEPLPVRAPPSSKSTASSESDSTSILIMKQLSQEAPPSNQELGILMSSSPSRSMDHALQSPVCLPARQNIRARKSGKSDHDQKNRANTPKGAIENDCRDVDLEVTPNFERALSQVETPSTKSRSSQMQKTPIDISVSVPGTPPRMIGRLVVKVPQLSAKKQAEYKIVPETNQGLSVSASFKSFKEINRVHVDAVNASQDSGSAAIEQVLNASPSWLTSITEIRPQSPDTPKKPPYRLRSSTTTTTTTPCKKMPTTPPKLELDLTKDQDPTYQPSEPSSASESSADTESKRGRKVVETPATLTSRKPTQALESGCDTSPVHHQKTNLAPVATVEDIDTRSQLIHSTPVPAPSIPELMQRIKATPLSRPPKVLLVSEQTKSLSDLSSESSRSSHPLNTATMASPTIPPALVIDNARQDEHHSTTKKHNKRKRTHEHIDQDGSHHTASRKKKHKGKKSSKITQKWQGQRAKKHKSKGAQGTGIFDQSLNSYQSSRPRGREVSRVLNELDRGHYMGKSSSPPNVDSLVAPGTEEKVCERKHKLQTRRRQNRQRSRAQDTGKVGSTLKYDPDRPPIASLSIMSDETAPISKPQSKITAPPEQTFQAKARHYDQNRRLLATMAEPMSTQYIATTTKDTIISCSAQDTQEQKNKGQKPMPRKLLSPPITSRPSSAGSAS